MKEFLRRLNNVPIRKKFDPLLWVIILNIVFISLFSFSTAFLQNKSSENIIDRHVRHKEQLSAIIRNMYVCRVLGRDILFANEQDVTVEYYKEYLAAFNALDDKMEKYSFFLKGEQLAEFEKIIVEKNKYKEAMILSADIWMSGGEFDEAVLTLQGVTPIANAFFGSIDNYSNEEERMLNLALKANERLVIIIFASGVIFNSLVIAFVIFFVSFFSKSMSISLIKLEKAMSEIAETDNLQIKIPEELYTKDEVGRIAKASNKLKTMLLEYSFREMLTGGLNTKAYYEELNEIFDNEKSENEIWCVIADMNNLKMINDQLGHIEGDNAIRNSYHCVNNNFKEFGKTFRVGGDEFVSLLKGCTQAEVDKAISKIIEEIDGINKNNEPRFSLAFGCGQFSGNTLDEYKEFFKAVDKKMYANKLACKQARLRARVQNPINKDDL